MVEGFDARTLTTILLLLGIIQGIGLTAYAKTHPVFRGFWHIGVGYLLMAFGFALISAREFISDWYAIIFAGFCVIISLQLIGVGILRFFGSKTKNYQALSYSLSIVQLVTFYYFTVIEFEPKWRVFIICSILTSQLIFIAFKLFGLNKQSEMFFVRSLAVSFVIYASIFIARATWSLAYADNATAFQLTVSHITSLLTFFAFLSITSFIIPWVASHRLHTDLKKQTSIDPLTQVYNRRALESQVSKEIARAERLHSSLAIILIDIDHFKKVNDIYGHQVGDQILVEFCQRISSTIRNYDVVARYGGEEFVVLLPDTTSQEAYLLAEKLRLIIMQTPFIIASTLQRFDITASSGVASLSSKNIKWEKLFTQADNAMYQAKKEGRNRVCLAEANSPVSLTGANS